MVMNVDGGLGHESVFKRPTKGRPDFNPFIVMEKYTEENLKEMDVDALIKVQRSILFPHEIEAFDARVGGVTLAPGDGRGEFLDYVDGLICDLQSIGA